MKEKIHDSLRLLKKINHLLIEESKVSSNRKLSLQKIKRVFANIVTMYKSISTFTEFERVCIQLIEEIAQEYNTIIMLL